MRVFGELQVFSAGASPRGARASRLGSIAAIPRLPHQLIGQKIVIVRVMRFLSRTDQALPAIGIVFFHVPARGL